MCSRSFRFMIVSSLGVALVLFDCACQRSRFCTRTCFSCSDLCIVRLSTCLASVARALASLFGVRRGLQVLARRGVPKCAVNAISRPASSRSHHIVFREIDGEFV